MPTRGGLRVIPDEIATRWPEERRLPSIDDRRPTEVLDETLDAIADRYGARTADLVAMQLEYPRR